MQIIDGKAIAAEIKAEIAARVAALTEQGHRRPHLAAILVGNDGGSQTYVNNKVKACADCGFRSSLITLPESADQASLMAAIAKLNDDPEVDGFIVQLPLPRHLDEQQVIEAIRPDKDVDGFHPMNVGLQAIGLPCFHSATPAGIVELLRRYHIPTRGRNVVIIGRSNIVGKPLATMLMQKGEPGDATVTVCHSATEGLAEICRRADILVAAMGRPGFVTADMVKPGATVIDVGTTRVADASKPKGFRLCGDVDFDSVAPLCSYITPVPGGVGPMTIVSLMTNTLRAFERKIGR